MKREKQVRYTIAKPDVEKCFEVGMNGYVCKPIDFDEVFSLLRKYL